MKKKQKMIFLILEKITMMISSMTRFESCWRISTFFLLCCFCLNGQQDKNDFKGFDPGQKVSQSEKELYFQRLETINSINTIKIRKNLSVAKQVKRYLGFSSLPYTMGKADFYFYFFEKKLRKYGLPEELKYLAVIESAMNPRAKSKVGAMGLWQFMPNTGVQYGLYHADNVSLFYDPIASTDAACRYLLYLYKKFKDWELVLTAYNYGEGRLLKLIKKTGKKTFWQLQEFLPKETKTYVPSFLAVQYIFNFYEYHGIQPMKLKLSPQKMSIHKTTQTVRKSILQEGVKKEVFAFLNPHIIGEQVPSGTIYYSL
ncbi:lytic transglycosylase domain-containing protein [Croceivirga sp. JEA036]|uniref:lytic transglycosylase domain-containing protein n=1 Tax=Croceivirga sp. JEA036 TaxID=2721162 RepID=UPI001439E000|nr:lytic transglycosylase domain-containing protein [Croceivirga sp. JEA036]NJB38138.1 lytic transglycosylase domain-containing protein [Croceivirga sp. JEA036]